jgi:hypothetical protein
MVDPEFAPMVGASELAMVHRFTWLNLASAAPEPSCNSVDRSECCPDFLLRPHPQVLMLGGVELTNICLDG